MHLLLLRSQLDLRGSPPSSAFPATSVGFNFFFFCVPSCSSVVHLLLLRSKLYLWGSPFWVRFLLMWLCVVVVFNPTIEVVTFRLRGRYILGVFLLPAFTCLGHEYQDLLSPCAVYSRVHKLALVLYSHPKECLGNGVRTHVNPKGKISSSRDSAEGQTRNAASHRTASPTHYRLSYPDPWAVSKPVVCAV